MPEDKSPKPAEAESSALPEAESLDSPEPAASSSPGPASSPPKAAAKGPGQIQKIRTRVNIYLVIFILLGLTGAAVVFVSIKPAKEVKETPIGKLTDQQLAALRSNSTLVGDPKQTLDIQSNTIFEGQILARSDLSVAGSLKVGSGLNLPSITITGGANLAQAGITGPLSVGGDANIQGGLVVQKNLNVTGSASFGSLSVASLSITSLQVKNDFSISRHITTSGGNPGQANGTALGSGGTASVSGSDTAGTVNINTGGSPPAGIFVTVIFNQKFTSTPSVVITPVGSASGSIQYYVNRDTNGFSIGASNAPPASSNFAFDYHVLQ
jgi:hypothetical protein